MGSGGMIVMDETSCMVDVAKYFMEFCMTRILRQVRSLPRRHATRCTTSWQRSQHGRPRQHDLALLEELCDLVQATPACAGWGRSAPNPVLSTLRYFRDEYRAHIEEHKLPGRESADRSSRVRMTRMRPQVAYASRR